MCGRPKKILSVLSILFILRPTMRHHMRWNSMKNYSNHANNPVLEVLLDKTAKTSKS